MKSVGQNRRVVLAADRVERAEERSEEPRSKAENDSGSMQPEECDKQPDNSKFGLTPTQHRVTVDEKEKETDMKVSSTSSSSALCITSPEFLSQVCFDLVPLQSSRATMSFSHSMEHAIGFPVQIARATVWIERSSEW